MGEQRVSKVGGGGGGGGEEKCIASQCLFLYALLLFMFGRNCQ